MLGAFILGGASLLGSALGARSNSKTNAANMELARYQNEWQTQENEKAFQRSVHMWNLQNEYNSPTQQMARLRSAGLNPNLVYGNGAVGNSAGSAPQYEPADIERAHLTPYRGWNAGLTDAATTFLSARTNKAQVDNMEAQNALIRQQAATEGLKQANIAASTARSEFDLSQANRLKDVSVARAEAEMSQAQHQADITWSRSEQERVKSVVDRALQDTRIKLGKAQYAQTLEAVTRLMQDNDINKFRYNLERIYGKESNAIGLARDLFSRMSTLLFRGSDYDKMFNPKF